MLTAKRAYNLKNRFRPYVISLLILFLVSLGVSSGFADREKKQSSRPAKKSQPAASRESKSSARSQSKASAPAPAPKAPAPAPTRSAPKPRTSSSSASRPSTRASSESRRVVVRKTSPAPSSSSRSTSSQSSSSGRSNSSNSTGRVRLSKEAWNIIVKNMRENEKVLNPSSRSHEPRERSTNSSQADNYTYDPTRNWPNSSSGRTARPPRGGSSSPVSPVIVYDRESTNSSSVNSGTKTGRSYTAGGVSSSRSASGMIEQRSTEITGTESQSSGSYARSSRKRIVITPTETITYHGDQIISRSEKAKRVFVPISEDQPNIKILKEITPTKDPAQRTTKTLESNSVKIGLEQAPQASPVRTPRQPVSRTLKTIADEVAPKVTQPALPVLIKEPSKRTKSINLETLQTIQRDVRNSATLNNPAAQKTPLFGLDSITTPAAVNPVQSQSSIDGTLDQGDIIDAVNITGDNNIYIGGDLNVEDVYYPYLPSRSYSLARHLAHTSVFHPYYDHRWRSDYYRLNRYSSSGFYFQLGYHFDDWNLSFGYSSRPYYSGRVVYYRSGPCYGVSYIYPSYHRKYVFWSVGGYWPRHYSYHRYYRYGCHPHRWYGCYPERETVVKEYNTYNYYYNDSSASYGGYSASPSYSYSSSGDIVPDYDALAKVRQRLEAINPNPSSSTERADYHFDLGVDAFEEKDYERALGHFKEALLAEPDDIVLPFTYCQALFANAHYARAASVLKTALANIPEDFETVFFPRGLYQEDDTLLAQIRHLELTIDNEPLHDDHILLLGYQYLGLGLYEQAETILNEAVTNQQNAQSAWILLRVIEEAKKLD